MTRMCAGGVSERVVWTVWVCAGGGDGRGGVAMGRGTAGGARSLPPTPHLTSPLEGGRDELGKGEG